MEQQEALHLEPDIRIDGDPQTVEDAGSWRFEVSVLDHEPVFHDAGRDSNPQVNHVGARQLADDAGTDKFCDWEEVSSAASATRNFRGSIRVDLCY